jgi:hypothetical protein
MADEDIDILVIYTYCRNTMAYQTCIRKTSMSEFSSEKLLERKKGK